MGETNNPLSGKIDVDVSNVKDGLAQLNRSIREVESSFRASAAGLGNWAATSEGLEKREKALTEEIALQQKKVTLLNTAYQQMVAEKGSNSSASEELHIKLNKELAALGKMEGELKRSGTELGQMESGTNKAASGMNNLETQTNQAHHAMSGFKNMLSTMGGVIAGIGLSNLAGAAIGAVTGLGRLFLGAAATADDLGELSQKTGISTQKLQELSYIGKQSGIDLDTMTGSLSKMIRSMDAAGKYGSPAAQAFRELGVATQDSKGNLLDSNVVFDNTIAALGKVSNETERDALAMQIFGKSAMEMNPLIQLGADGIKNMSQEAHNVGAVMSDETIKAAGDLNDKIDSLKASASGIVGTLLGALAPGLQTVTDGLKWLLEGVMGVISGFQLTQGLGERTLGKFLEDLTGKISGALNAGLKIMQGVMQGIISALPIILPAAVKIITQLVTFIVQSIPMLLEAGVQIVTGISQAILPMLPMLLDAVMKIVIELANALSAALPVLMPVIAQVIGQLAVVIANNVPLLVEASLKLWNALAQGLILAIPILIQQLPLVWQALNDAFVAAWPQIEILGWQLLTKIVVGISNALPGLITTSQQILEIVGKTITDGINYMVTIGKAMADGLWQGIQSKAKELKQNLINWMLDMIGAARKAVGYGSPAKEFIKIGESMAQGLGIGFADQMHAVENRIANTMGNLGSGGLALAGGGVYSPQSNTNYYFGPVYQGAGGSAPTGSQDDNRVLRF